MSATAAAVSYNDVLEVSTATSESLVHVLKQFIIRFQHDMVEQLRMKYCTIS